MDAYPKCEQTQLGDHYFIINQLYLMKVVLCYATLEDIDILHASAMMIILQKEFMAY